MNYTLMKILKNNEIQKVILMINETKPCPWGNPRPEGHGGEI